MRDLDDLKRRTLEVAVGRVKPEGLEAEIRQRIRDAKADPELTLRLELLLGDLACWAKGPAEARLHYRKALKIDPGSSEAMIGIGNTFESISRLGKAKEWFDAAYRTAEEKHNHTWQMFALDALACNAVDRNDAQALADALDTMCRVLESAPLMPDVHTVIASALIRERKGPIALPFLGCFIRHMLERGYTRSSLYLALCPFVEIHRRDGRSDDEIFRILDEARISAADETTATNFDVVVRRAFEKSHLHYDILYKDDAG